MSGLATTSLTETERRTLERLVELLETEFGPDLHGVWLFGSRARGERRKEESDVDLLILTEKGWDHDSRKVFDLVYEAADAEGYPAPFISPHVRDTRWVEERRAIQDFFIQEVDRDRVVLFGAG